MNARIKTLAPIGLVLGLCLFASSAFAQAATAAPVATPRDQRTVQGPETLLLQEERGERPPPLGAEMFMGTPTPSTANGAVVDPNHILRPGDRVRVTLWGLVNEDQELTIDAQGNVVVPGVGPVPLAGVPANQAPRVIETASRRIYSEGVRIYATATSAATSQILVTGPVVRPGAYPGSSDESLIVYLQRAGGIDAERGSYRRVRIVRNGQTVANADLYEFLRAGITPAVSFRNGDAVVVEDQGATVAVTGDVRSTYSFELLGATGQGAEIMQYARPRPGATHAAVIGVRNAQPFSVYLTLEEFAGFTLSDGDRVQFEADAQATDVLVRVEASHQGPSVFSVPRGTSVGAVLAQLSLSPSAEYETIHLRRESVRRTQKALLDDSLDRLERTVLTSPSRSAGEAAARSTDIQATERFIQTAREAQPLGILALNGRDPNTVILETGDVIVVPTRSQTVTIAGEVQAPQTVLAESRARVGTYVDLAGGFGPRADRRRVLVFKQDGQLREGGYVLPGDRILVLSKPASALLPLLGDLAAIMLGVARLV